MQSIREIYKIGRGPSSSHTMGPERAAMRFQKEHPEADRFVVRLYGSLAKTGKGHGTDRVLMATLAPVRTEIEWIPEPDFPLEHPNTLDLLAFQGEAQTGFLRALSVGGGDVRYPGEAEAEKRGAQLVLFGHTHQPYTAYHGGIYYLNPGSLGHPRAGAPSYGVVDITAAGIVPHVVEVQP